MPHAAVSPYEAGAWENPSWWWSEVKKGPAIEVVAKARKFHFDVDVALVLEAQTTQRQ